jgi:hypothetical protein
MTHKNTIISILTDHLRDITQKARILREFGHFSASDKLAAKRIVIEDFLDANARYPLAFALFIADFYADDDDATEDDYYEHEPYDVTRDATGQGCDDNTEMDEPNVQQG